VHVADRVLVLEHGRIVEDARPTISSVAQAAGTPRCTAHGWSRWFDPPRWLCVCCAIVREPSAHGAESMTIGLDSKHWILLDDPLEVTQWAPGGQSERMAVRRVRARDIAQDRRAIVGEVLDQAAFSRLPCSNATWLSARTLRTQFVLSPKHGHG